MGLLTQQVRIDISSMHSYSPDDIQKMLEVTGLSEEELMTVMREYSSETKTFGFYTFKQTIDELELIYSNNQIYDLDNPEIQEELKKYFAK